MVRKRTKMVRTWFETVRIVAKRSEMVRNGPKTIRNDPKQSEDDPKPSETVRKLSKCERLENITIRKHLGCNIIVFRFQDFFLQTQMLLELLLELLPKLLLPPLFLLLPSLRPP